MTLTNIFGLFVLSLISCCVIVNCATMCITKCPRGGKVYSSGFVDHKNIVGIHNKYRNMVLSGNVSGQPRARAMKMLVYDKHLGNLAKNVTHTCKMEHVIVQDERWLHVGQNLYIERSSKFVKGQNWDTAIFKWFDEHKVYHYPNGPTKKTGHYTQLMAQNTTTVGCDFIFFYDAAKPKTPYSKLYACNYGPAGNMAGQPPYERSI